MKQTFLLFSFLFGLWVSPLTAESQTRDFNGTWSGDLLTSTNKTLYVKLLIEDNNVYALTQNDNGDWVKDRSREICWSKGYGEQLNFVWMNKSVLWTETQVSSLVWIKKGTISVHFLRHVSNKSKDYDGNSDWGYTATGTLNKE